MNNMTVRFMLIVQAFLYRTLFPDFMIEKFEMITVDVNWNISKVCWSDTPQPVTVIYYFFQLTLSFFDRFWICYFDCLNM